MVAWVIPPVAGLIEPVEVQEIFIDGTGAIQRSGDNLKIYLYSTELPLDQNPDAAFKVVRLKIVRPMYGMNETLSQIKACLASGEHPWPRPRLVR